MTTRQQYCTFYLGEHCFGLDVLRVQEIVRSQTVTRVPLAPDVVHGLMNLRGQIVTAIDLRRRLGLPDRDANVEPVNVVVQTDEGAIALLVDEIDDVLEVGREQFERPPQTLQGAARDLIQGVYKLPERLLVVLDLDRILLIP
ncbi:MAG TPA: chemotaxis protein CheW [Pirellulales bacterium]